jgi:hypothetical protein
MRESRRARRSIWFWIFVVVVVVILLGLLFGGYRKGTKVNASGDGVSAVSTGQDAVSTSHDVTSELTTSGT